MAIDFRKKTYILDGAMGTMLQKAGMRPDETTSQFGLDHPDICRDIYTKYIDAGSDIIYAGTFGMNRCKQDEFSIPAPEAVARTMDTACRARDDAAARTGRQIYVALGMGPVGELLEPMGTMTFEEAYEIFAEVVDAGKDHGADLIVIETMTDLYEAKAALLAAKEHSDLPVMVSMTFEEDQRTFTGVSLEAMAVTLEGLGADAIGINCSLGPEEIFPMAQKLRSLTDLPVFAKPNAGLPDPETGEYDITCGEFAGIMQRYFDAGIDMAGGCCGTTPEHIALMAQYRDSMPEKTAAPPAAPRRLRVCSSTDVVCADHVTVIGERINPTGKKRLKQALLEDDHDYIMSQAIEQTEAGAEILDVNVGVPALDDTAVLPRIVKKLQSVTGAPLQIDSSNPEAIEAALRVYNGKAVVNSVNGDDDVMDAIFPSVVKYGAAVIGLTLDSRGIPAKAEDRFAIAEHILEKARSWGIPDEDLIIDCLTLTVSAQQKEVAETLKAVRMVSSRLGLKTALGVSNISFGLPARVLVNRTFLAMALENGLDLPIINPNDEEMMSTIYAFNVLRNKDVNASAFIERYSGYTPAAPAAGNDRKSTGSSENEHRSSSGLAYHIEKGMKADTVAAVQELLKETDEMTIVNSHLIPALDKVGKGFEKGTIFLPQMLQAASAAQAGFDIIRNRLAQSGRSSAVLGEIVIATVKGDIHDIGKNIVKVILENYGFRITDLGKDVPPGKIVDAVTSRKAKLLGLSALMTTTLGSMEETIKAVKEAAPYCRIMVGGAVLTAEYAEKIGADYYCADAMGSVQAAQEVFG